MLPSTRPAFAGLRVCFDLFRSKRDAPARSRVSRLLFIIRRSIICLFILSLAVVVWLRWVPPYTSAVMIEERFSRFFSGKKQDAIRYQWVDLESISPYMRLAVVASEDQSFPDHCGFDFESIRQAVEERKRRGRLRGASTITQQTAKNLFLWNGRSYVRKGFEAYFAILLELLWPKNRILEVYLNIAQFGDGVYGVGAAAKTYLHKSPSKLTRRDAALLAAVLPNPKRFKVRRPSSHVRTRRSWILRQMNLLGGVGYLRDL
ncbi:MAG: monofunctional biosynthetic peptidoglycan transglycosylase [Desulfomonilaceae bacterium]|nr:monofunctional biosynthetic peptidoglycan transglycosylase [Desulfomonilaceae bacterium]